MTYPLPVVSEKCPREGFPSRGYRSRNWSFWKPQIREGWLEVISRQGDEPLCNRNATPVTDWSHRLPDCCYPATCLGQGQSPHTGTASDIDLAGSPHCHFRTEVCLKERYIYSFVCLHQFIIVIAGNSNTSSKLQSDTEQFIIFVLSSDTK